VTKFVQQKYRKIKHYENFAEIFVQLTQGNLAKYQILILIKLCLHIDT